MKKPCIFISGASGFIARNIIEQLRDRYIFFAPTHKQLDLLDESNVELFFNKHRYFDFVIHTAIVGGNRKIPDTTDVAISNLRMFANIIKNREHFGKMIHLGSGIEYGRESPLKKIREEDFDKRIPQGNFGFYKYLCAKYIENSEGIINLRIFGIWGKYEDSTIRFISNAICKSILRMPITIYQNVYFDYLYIDDFAKILNFFLTHKAHHKSYNVGTGRSINLVTIANKINSLATFKSPIKIKHEGLSNEYTCNNKRLMEELVDFKFTNFEKSLREFYNWYLQRKNMLKRKGFLDDHFD